MSFACKKCESKLPYMWRDYLCKECRANVAKRPEKSPSDEIDSDCTSFERILNSKAKKSA